METGTRKPAHVDELCCSLLIRVEQVPPKLPPWEHTHLAEDLTILQSSLGNLFWKKKKQKTSSGDHSTILCYSLKVGHVFLKRGKWSLITFFFPFFPDVRSRKRHLHSILWLLVSLGPSGHLDSTLTPTPPHCSTSWMNGLSTCLVHFLLGSLSSECINLNLFKPLKLSVLFKHSIVLCEFF